MLLNSAGLEAAFLAVMEFLPFVAILIAMNVELTYDLILLPGLLKEIAKKEARWSKLLNDIKLPIIGVDSKGIVNYVNPYFLSLTGFTYNEVLGKRWIDNFIPEGNRQHFKEVRRRISSVLVQCEH